MAITGISDLHSITQIGPAVLDVLFAEAALLAIPGLVANIDGKHVQASGEAITFRVWETDIANITKDAIRNNRIGITPSKINLTSYPEQAMVKSISFDADQFAIDDSSEDALDHMSQIVAHEFAQCIQANLIGQAVADVNGTDLEHDVSGTSAVMTVDALLRARLKWGEKAGSISPVAFITTKQFIDLAESEDYKKLAVSGGSALVKQEHEWKKYVVAYIHGMPICLCDSLPISIDATPKHTALLVGQNAFGVYIGSDPKWNETYHSGSTVKTFDTHWRVATTLYRHKPRRVVKLITV